MSRIRFATAREVFEAFPGVRGDIGAPPTEDPPLTFMRALLESATPEDALSFCAYVLPRREAVWWACQCVRTLVPEPGPDGETALRAAEAWVREPDEPRRRTALAIGTKANPRAAQSWVALAAAWSGGSMNEGENFVPTAPDLTANAARIAVLTALARVSARDRAAQLKVCYEGGVRLAMDGRSSE
ncbi:MAG TPA: hypothetical protein VKA90_04580 [Beijerinckiaceae bacterium]|nr:hypothetical protein [Beijerinckiaceae bacterium]